MKKVLLIVRILVGVLFIFSGMIKANDPHGLGYKMQEFFEVWNEGLNSSGFFLKNILISLFDFFHEHALLLAVVMIALEIIAGFALIIGWRMRFFSWLLLLMIIFFTFLTGYAVLAKKPDGSPRFTNCGCFGDCIPITPGISFTKDIILTILIVLLFFFRKKIMPAFSNRASLLLMSIVTVFSLGVQWYSLSYLPPLDCLPFKKGKNISEQMKMPANAIRDSVVITYVYEKGGNQIEFTADKFPADFSSSTYKFIKRYDKVVRKGKNNEPPIKGFVLTGNMDIDSAQYILNQPYSIILFAEDFSKPVKEWAGEFEKIYRQAKEKNISSFLITTRLNDATAALAGTSFSDIQKLKCDVTVVRTAARSNPCLYILKQGTVIGKWSDKQFNKANAELNKIGMQPVIKNIVDTIVSKQIDSIGKAIGDSLLKSLKN